MKKSFKFPALMLTVFLSTNLFAKYIANENIIDNEPASCHSPGIAIDSNLDKQLNNIDKVLSIDVMSKGGHKTRRNAQFSTDAITIGGDSNIDLACEASGHLNKDVLFYHRLKTFNNGHVTFGPPIAVTVKQFTAVIMCGTSGDYTKIVIPIDRHTDCNVERVIPAKELYTGPCQGGWVLTSAIKQTGG